MRAKILMLLTLLITAVTGAQAKTTITIGNVVNGTVTSDRTEAQYGETVTLTPTPNAGARLLVITVKGDDSGDEVGLTRSSEGTYYTFQMPDEPVTVNATFLGSTEYITDVMVIGSDNINDLMVSRPGWKECGYDLNAGTKGDYVVLLCKTATSSDGVNHGYITDFYITNHSNSSGYPATLTHDGRTYYPVAYDGSQGFKNVHGDLNCGVSSSADIHLYYTRDYFPDNRAVSSININATQAGAVGLHGGTDGYDLNTGAHGDYIYMHLNTAPAYAPEQVLWCSSQKTLFSLKEDVVYSSGDTYNEQYDITSVWRGSDVIATGTSAPGWANNADVKANATKVVVDASFADAKPTSLYQWFSGLSALKSIDVNSLDVSSVTNADGMFANSPSLERIYCDDAWSIAGTGMFSGSNKLVGAIRYDAGKNDATYANPTTGYFSKQWNLTVNTSDHGTMTPSTATPYSNETVTLTANPEDGFVLSDLLVYYIDMSTLKKVDIPVTKVSDTQYTFIMPASTAAVTPSFALNFGDDVATGVTNTNFTDGTDQTGGWYDLSGRRLTSKPTQKGIYINKGKRIMIK